jgi:hypothetical protein
MTVDSVPKRESVWERERERLKKELGRSSCCSCCIIATVDCILLDTTFSIPSPPPFPFPSPSHPHPHTPTPPAGFGFDSASAAFAQQLVGVPVPAQSRLPKYRYFAPRGVLLVRKTCVLSNIGLYI